MSIHVRAIISTVINHQNHFIHLEQGMNLFTALEQRQNEGKPVRVGIIGAGKFAAMFMAQSIRTPGISLKAVCDLDLDRAKNQLINAGYRTDDIVAGKIHHDRSAKVTLVEDFGELANPETVDIVVESTGDPIFGSRHALHCIENGLPVVMVNVEADVLVGPMLAAKARQNDVIYSMAYGDQPALIAELVDTVRTMGLNVVCAGKGTKYLPSYHASTPETVWDYYGLTRREAEQGGMNSKMFNSFLDGTKSAIEMAAVSNSTGLMPPQDGLSFPPCSVDELADCLRPVSDGGTLPEKGMVEVISSLHRDGSEVQRDLRWGVYAVFEAGTQYVKQCFREYGLVTDSTGKYSALYRPYHLIGLELGVSIASVAIRREPTGVTRDFSADVVCVAKCNLQKGEVLDGEGGSTVWGKIIPAQRSIEIQAVPIGLANGLKLNTEVSKGEVIHWSDVQVPQTRKAYTDVYRLRKKMEAQFRNYD